MALFTLASAPLLVASPAVLAAQETREVHIPAGDLGTNLSNFSAQQGVSISFDPALTQGLSNTAISGNYSTQQALAQLLKGSGLIAVQQSGGHYQLQKSFAPARAASTATPVATTSANASANTQTLDTMTVVASGPVNEAAQPNTNYTVRSSNSAAKLDLAPKETPQSFTSMTSQQMEDQGFNSLSQALDYTPGMTVIQAGVTGAGGTPIYSRTFPVRAVTMDGVIGSTFLLSGGPEGNINMQDPFLYERIDVVRGANGLTSGSGDPSASLDFVRKHPYQKRHLTMAAKIGSWNTRRSELDLSLPVTDRFRTRFAMAVDGGNSWVKNVRHNSMALSWINDFDLTDNDNLSVGATYYDFTIHGASPHGFARFSEVYDKRPSSDNKDPHIEPNKAMGRNKNNATPWSKINRDYRNVFATYSHFFDNGWEFKLSYNYADNHDKEAYGEMGTKWYLPDRDTANYSSKYINRRNIVNTWDAHLKGSFSLFGRDQDFIIGYDYFDTQSYRYTNYFNSPAEVSDPSATAAVWRWDPSFCSDGWESFCEENWGPRGISPSDWENGQYPGQGSKKTDGIVKHEQIEQGTYFNTHWRLLPRTHLILGGRWALMRYKIPKYSGPSYPNGGPSYAGEEAPRHVRPDFMPYGGLIIELTKNINAYYSYTKSFVQNENPTNNRNPYTGTYMEPFKWINKEGGLKAGFFDNRLNLSASYFDIVQKNFPFYNATDWVNGNGSGTKKGVDGYHAYGYELTIAGEITPRWRINAGYVRQHQSSPVLTDSNVFFLDSDNDNGDYMAPEKTLKIFTSYNVTDQLTLGAGMRHQSSVKTRFLDRQYGNAVLREGSYEVYDAMARYQFNQNLGVQLNVNNIFDKTYYQHERSYISGAPRNALLSMFYTL